MFLSIVLIQHTICTNLEAHPNHIKKGKKQSWFPDTSLDSVRSSQYVAKRMVSKKHIDMLQQKCRNTLERSYPFMDGSWIRQIEHQLFKTALSPTERRKMLVPAVWHA